MGSTEETLRRELASEQAHMDLVYRYLEVATKSAQQAAKSGQNIYHSERDTWVREEDTTALFERDAFAFQAAKRLQLLEKEHDGLVFGRLDLASSEVQYIGRIGVRNEEYEPLVIDWRAKAAEPFYRATATRPMGVARRRVLKTSGQKVTGIEDDLLDADAGKDLPVIGEGALMAALTRSRGNQMRDIVATIQAEQDEAIRADYQGVTTISGGPGTGKTVVALHRAAYLLYSNRRRFESGGILVIGPTATFLNYIERVLPSLGEDSVTLRALGQVASDVLDLSATRVDSDEAAALKGSLRMKQVLKRLVSMPLVHEAVGGLSVTAKGVVVKLDAAELARIRKDVLTRQPVNQGKDAAEEAVLKALWAKVPEDLGLSEEKFRDLAMSAASYRMFMQSWWPSLTPTQVLARLGEPFVAEAVGKDILSEEEISVLADSYKEDSWSVSDIPLLDELYELLGPVVEEKDGPDDLIFLSNDSSVSELVTVSDVLDAEDAWEEDPLKTYAHILVDEAQDLSPMQWRMLRRRGEAASWTIVGDPAQSSWPDPEEGGQALKDLIGSHPHRKFKLTKNYRSPAEVFDLAGQVIQRVFPDADLPEAVRATGVEPELDVVASSELDDAVISKVEELTELVSGTIGVIVPKSLRPRVEGLTKRLNQAHPGLVGGHARVHFLTPLESKGLEYDAVVVLDPDSISHGTPAGTRLLYVCLTRPTQRLVVFDVDKPGAWRV
ncbi:MAG: AAA family ATPase [Propionibacteriaceae bacterium]|nr:AAA family ATPase [Propionibacteriaceae bacterium]